MPIIEFSQDAFAHLKTFFEDYPERYEEARTLFVLHVAKALLEAVAERAPDIGTYPASLRIGVVEGVKDWSVAMVYAEDQHITVRATDSRLAWIKPSNRDATSAVLAKYNPWPISMIPLIEKDYADGIYVRTFGAEVVAEILDARMGQIDKINEELAEVGTLRVGAPDPEKIGTAYVDLAFEVLRLEHGVDSRSAPHWRPALRALKSSIASGGKAVVKYMQSGSAAGFDLPDPERMNKSDLERIRQFQERIV